MPIQTSKWDTTDYLDSEEAIEAYLEACREENDPAFLEMALKNVERARAKQAAKPASSSTE